MSIACQLIQCFYCSSELIIGASLNTFPSFQLVQINSWPKSLCRNVTAISVNVEAGKSAIEEDKWKVVQSVTAGILCLLKVRFALLDHVAMLGHLPVVSHLTSSVYNEANYPVITFLSTELIY